MDEFTKLLVWQMAQILGYEGQIDLAEHALLLLVDYDEDAFYPVFIGKSLELGGMGPEMTWSEDVRHLTTEVITEEYRSELAIFFSEQAARRKFEKRRVYDAVNYVSRLSNGKKWTHCIQALFKSRQSIEEIADQLRRELPFADAPGIIFLDLPPVPAPDREHLLAYFLVIEVDAIRKSLESLRYLARHDQLTGLYNRHMMADIVDDGPSEVIIIDVDKFKEINDGYGHDTGDEALCALANRLERIFWHHDRDLVFRLGGDEFLVVMREAEPEEAEACIRRLCEPIELTTEASERIVSFTVSVGSARCDGNFKAALRAADAALYRVKENGRNGFCRAGD